ncbi:MAG: hypothetical protein AAFP90_14215 [Planctomycetota bacterium]
MRFLKIAGETQNHIDLRFPSAFFHAHDPQPGSDYGRTVMRRAYRPWSDKAFPGGGSAVRRLFMFRNAFGGHTLWYPADEDLDVEGEDEGVSALTIAKQITNNLLSGGNVQLPSDYDHDGNKKWDIQEATIPSNPTHIFENVDALNREIRHGIGIPDQIIDNEGSGGWAGARIPMATFYASLDRWVVSIASDFCTQVIDPLILHNWGQPQEYELTHKPLAVQAMEQQSHAGQGQDLNRNGIPDNQEPNRQQRMSLDPVAAVGDGVLDAAELVQAASEVIAMSQRIPPGTRRFRDGKEYELRNSRWHRVDKRETSIGMISSSVKKDANLEEAFRDATGERFVNLKNDSQQIDESLGIRTTTLEVIGDWKSNAEPSLVTYHDKYRDYEEVKYRMAHLGLRYRQLAVIAFQETSGGEEHVYQIQIPGTIEEVRKKLDSLDIKERSIAIQNEDSVTVIVYNYAGSGYSPERMQKSGDELNATIRETQGKGDYIGVWPDDEKSDEENRDDAARIYREIIENYETKFPDRPFYPVRTRLGMDRDSNFRMAKRPCLLGVALSIGEPDA